MTIRILCVGKIKEAFYRDAIAELMKRIGRYAAAEVIEVAEEKAPEGLSQAEKEQILANEGERLLAGKSRIVFIIGGSFGLHPSVKRRADMLLSFSDMTFPHQLFRVMLSEQIYRAFKINNNEPYHK